MKVTQKSRIKNQGRKKVSFKTERLVERSWTFLGVLTEMMKEPIKACQLSRRGVSESSGSWGEKPRTLKPNGAPRFLRLEPNFTLTDCGVRSFPVEVEELPAERRWDVLPAPSESRRGRNMKRTFSPSLPPSIRPRSSPNPSGTLFGSMRPRSRCPVDPAFIHCFSPPKHQICFSKMCSLIEMSMFHVWVQCRKLHLKLAYLFGFSSC